MADQLIGMKGSDYPVVNSAFTPEDRASFLATTLVHAVGKKAGSEAWTDGNLTLEDLKSDQIQADWAENDSTKVSYIKNKPTIPSIEGLATEAELSTVSGEIVSQIPSLDEYATKQYVNTATEGMATQAWVGEQGYLTSIPPQYVTDTDLESAVSGKAEKSEIPDVSEFVTQEDIDEAVSGKMDVSQSASFYPMDSNPAGYLTEHQSLDGYATVEYVNAHTSAFITSASLPDVSDMATETWVEEQGYLTAVPDEYVTSAELSSTSAAIVEKIPEVPTASGLAGNGLSAVDGKLVVDKPIPSTSAANNGDVLTYSSDNIVWAPAQGGGGGGSSGGYTVYNVSKTFDDLTPYVYEGDTLYALDISVVNHGLYFLDLHTISGEIDLKKIRVHIPALQAGDYYDIVIQTQMNDWSPTYKWEAYCENGPGSESAMTKIWYYDDYRDEFWEDTEFHLFGRHATIMRLVGGAGE